MSNGQIVAKHGNYCIRWYEDHFGNSCYVLFKDALFVKRHWDFNYLKERMYEGEANDAN